MPKEAKNSLQVNVYEVLSRAIEDGLKMGWRRAHKHTDTPGEESILEHQQNAIMSEVCEVFKFD